MWKSLSYLFLVGLLSGGLPGHGTAVRGSEPIESEPALFQMQYRGLSGEKDALRYHSYFGDSPRTTAPATFTESLNLSGGDIYYYSNMWMDGVGWTALEVVDRKTAFFHFDKNNDEVCSADERILPIEPTGINRSDFEFVTPDFQLSMLWKKVKKGRLQVSKLLFL